MAFDLSKLVVVCMRCPANATLLLVEMEAWHDSILIWCECHGEHVLGAVRGRDIRAARTITPATEPVRISMQSMERISREEAQQDRAQAEQQLAMVTKRLEALNHFLATEDVKLPEPGPHYQHDCERCTFLGRFGAADLYECQVPGDTWKSLIARRSSDPADYESVMAIGNATSLAPRYEEDHPLSEALRRVIAREAA